MSSTQGHVVKIIAESLHVPIESVLPDRTFKELRVDSLNALNILFAVEQEFGVAISNEQAASIRSVRDVIRSVDHILRDAEARRPIE